MRDDYYQEPSPNELAGVARGAAVCVVSGLAIASALIMRADGTESSFPSSPVCRIMNSLADGTTNVGSGTLVNVTADRRRGLVLTCAHLFADGVGRVVAQFPDGRAHGALLVAKDSDADLAAVEICEPYTAPAAVVATVVRAAQLTACGFGPNGEYRCAAGLALGTAERPGQSSIRIGGSVRQGDSGGGVFDAQGRLVAVIWGESGGVTYASSGPPLQRFLNRILGNNATDESRSSTVANCPDGRCPLLYPGLGFEASQPQNQPAPQRPLGGSLSGDAPAAGCNCGKALAELGAQIKALGNAKQDRGEFLRRGDLDRFALRADLTALERRERSRYDALRGRLEYLSFGGASAGRAAGLLAATALGLSGPAGLAIVTGATLGGWLLCRRIKARSMVRNGQCGMASARVNVGGANRKGATAAADTPFRGSTEVVDVQQPIERDDFEARQLLQLSQLEGRDPLQDAVAGRLALDRLDAIAESDCDTPRAQWADDLRRELRERFNDIAPAKFFARAEIAG